MSTTIFDEDLNYESFQELCDEVFGEGEVECETVSGRNDLTLMLTAPNEFQGFKAGFKKRLMRLKARCEGTPQYPAFLETVAMCSDWNFYNKAYAKLAAWDILWNNYTMLGMELNKEVKRSETYEGMWERGQLTKDGYLKDYGLYFDAGVMGDTVGYVMDVIIDTAIWESKILTKCPCVIRAEYPWDDNEGWYLGASDRLYLELLEILKFVVDNDELDAPDGELEFQSKAKPEVTWYICFTREPKEIEVHDDIYYLAEKTKDMMFKRFAGNFMKNDMYMQVLVSSPCFMNYHQDFYKMRGEYYDLLAYYTFCDHEGDEMELHELEHRYWGDDTVEETSKNLAGIIVIEDGIDRDWYDCHVYLNPNAKNKSELADFYLDTLNGGYDAPGILGSFLDYMSGAL